MQGIKRHRTQKGLEREREREREINNNTDRTLNIFWAFALGLL